MHIKWFTEEDAIASANFTEANYRYPQAIGAIDGTHIPVLPPADGKHDYICRKGYPSVVLQAVVDANLMFKDIYANTAGAAHDATVYYRSPLSTAILTSMPKHDKIINGHSVPLHILGDPAYALSTRIMKGYTGRNLSAEQESFNVYHSSARMCVERAFGKLKSRFRILQKRMDVDVERAPAIITACCILHNICEAQRVPMPALEEHQAQLYAQPARYPDNRIEENEASQMRDTIKDYLAQNYQLRQSFR